MNDRLAQNVRLYPWYAGFGGCYFWIPVFFLFFQSRFELAEVLRLEAIYYLAVVLLEVPSGYFSDRIGRRPTLLISSTALAVSYALFTLAEGFTAFAIAQVALAAGIAFRSGTDTSLHYDSLVALGRESEYTEREARAERVGFTAGAISALLGGLVASIELTLAYAMSLVTALAAVGVAWRFSEPPSREDERAERPVAQIVRCIGLLRNGALAWLFAFAVLMVVLNHIPYEFVQPYLGEIMGLLDLNEEHTPAVTGAVGALTMLVAARAALISPKMAKRYGTARTLLSATLLQGLIILVMSLVLHPVIVVLLLLRSAPGALAAAPMRGAIVPRVGTGQRATYLSIQSLVGRASFSVTLAGLSFVGTRGTDDWSNMERMLLISAAIAGVGLLVLGLTARAVGE